MSPSFESRPDIIRHVYSLRIPGWMCHEYSWSLYIGKEGRFGACISGLNSSIGFIEDYDVRKFEYDYNSSRCRSRQRDSRDCNSDIHLNNHVL